MVGKEENPPASLVDQLEDARKIVWSDGGSELVVVAKGTATGCVGVEQAILPKPGPAALATAGSGDVLSGMMPSPASFTAMPRHLPWNAWARGASWHLTLSMSWALRTTLWGSA